MASVQFSGQPSASNPLLILELTRLPDIIVFRQNAMLLLDRLLYRFADNTNAIWDVSSAPLLTSFGLILLCMSSPARSFMTERW